MGPIKLAPPTSFPFGYVFLFAFPAGWVLLAGSVGRWVTGVISYLAGGLLLVALHVLVLGGIPLSVLPFYWLFWPYFVLTMLGAFGWTVG